MGKSDKYKTKKELLAELEELRERFSLLEEQSTNGNSASAAPHEVRPSAQLDHISFEEVSLTEVADAVTMALENVVPKSVDIRFTAEERMGLVFPDRDVAHQVIVNLYLARSTAFRH